MIEKSIDSITKEDIESLVIDAVPESRTLDYKQKLPGNSDSEKYEFLADITSFANAGGGDILYGIREKNGMPEAAEGLSGINLDAETLRLDSMIRDGIAPRISGIRIIGIPSFSNGTVILIRVPNSWLSPHMITTRESRFYSRNNAGKYPLDITEIRSAFALSESLPEKIRRFRDDRISKIVANETPIKLTGLPKTVLHLLPIAALNPIANIDVATLRAKPLAPLGTTGYNQRLNFDGLLNFNPARDSGEASAYVQIFRTGAIETVSSYLINNRSGKRQFAGNYTERRLIAAAATYSAVLRDLGLQPPIFLMITLIGIKDYKLHTGPFSEDNFPIDRDTLFLPDIIVEGYDSLNGIAELFRPAFDALWQAGGFERSFSYDENGKWVSEN